MIARYTVLDEKAKKLILLRPYQIHAIEAIRAASKHSMSGFVWHTTGSGKTLTSYKATRNLLMDIPALDKAIFLIDRKDLDTQTTMAFQAYANNDLVDVDETSNVGDLKKKLKSEDRQVIVTTIQKLQRLITRRLEEDTAEYNKIRKLKIAFVVDECHRAVTPGTKRELERFSVIRYGLDLREHLDLQRILIHRWEICHVQQKNYMVHAFISILYRMLYTTEQFWAFR